MRDSARRVVEAWEERAESWPEALLPEDGDGVQEALTPIWDIHAGDAVQVVSALPRPLVRKYFALEHPLSDVDLASWIAQALLSCGACEVAIATERTRRLLLRSDSLFLTPVYAEADYVGVEHLCSLLLGHALRLGAFTDLVGVEASLKDPDRMSTIEGVEQMWSFEEHCEPS